MSANFNNSNGNDINATVKRISIMKRIAVAMGILLLILIIAILLLRSCQIGEPPHDSVDIPGNVIDPIPVEPSYADLEFSTQGDDAPISFDVSGMTGGSSVDAIYRIIATYNSDFILKFRMTPRENEEFQKLAEILKVKVELVGENGDTLMYDGLISEMPDLELPLSADGQTTTELLFRVTVYLDDPLPEEYYGQKLIADMTWWVEEQDSISIANNEFSTVYKGDPPPIATELDFIRLNEGDNTPFDMKNIQYGDSQTRYFAFEIAHGEDVKVLLDNTIAIDSRLADELHAKVELVGENGSTVLYDGVLRDLSAEHTVPANDSGKSTVYYKITVSAPSVSPVYWNMALVCDLSWSLEGTSEQQKVPDNSFRTPITPYIPPAPPTPPETATSIELSAKDGFDNLPFMVENMLPGDSAERYYCVSVTHDDPQTVRFSIAVDTAQKLSNVLRVKVEQLVPDGTDTILYDGLMKDCSAVDVSVTASTKTVTPIYYRVTVYTNGAEVGNEYAGEGLTADFSWQLQ